MISTLTTTPSLFVEFVTHRYEYRIEAFWRKIMNYVCSFLATLLLTKSTADKYVSVVNKQNYVYICIQVFPFRLLIGSHFGKKSAKIISL